MPRKQQPKRTPRKQDRKVKKVILTLCKTPHVWKFEKTDKGVKRTCTVCNFSVTEVGRDIMNTPLSVLAVMKKREFHPRRKVD